MGQFMQTIEIGDPTGTRFQALEAIVDTKVMFATVPSSVLHELGVQPKRQMRFRKSNGETVQRDIGQTPMRLQGQQMASMVVFGHEEDPVVIGANTLLGLMLDVSAEGDRLVPAVGLLPSLWPVESETSSKTPPNQEVNDAGA